MGASLGRAAGGPCSEVPPPHPPLGLKTGTGEEPGVSPESAMPPLPRLPWSGTGTGSCRAGAGVPVTSREAEPRNQRLLV